MSLKIQNTFANELGRRSAAHAPSQVSPPGPYPHQNKHKTVGGLERKALGVALRPSRRQVLLGLTYYNGRYINIALSGMEPRYPRRDQLVIYAISFSFLACLALAISSYAAED